MNGKVFVRELSWLQGRSSAFLFGPRMTGKTTLLKSLRTPHYFDLLDPEIELRLRANPRLFWEQIRVMPKGSLIVVDEIQKVPALLDLVQMGIEDLRHRFVLSGSSARKLKRGGANLLGGRLFDLKLHPLTAKEIGDSFDSLLVMQFGTLPRIYSLLISGEKHGPEEARRLLKSYVTTYIKEEIQAEAATRNVGAFQRFLPVAAQSNAQMIEFANISRECSVPMSTVKEYYSILEDTLLGEFLWPHDRSERKKARPKFYFFDCGVIRALQNRLVDPPTPVELGFLFETWLFREMVRIRDYCEKEHEFALWRSGTHEIDFLVLRGGKPLLGIECKTGLVTDLDWATVQAFRKAHPKAPLLVASLTDRRPRLLNSGVEIYPYGKLLDFYRKF